MVLLETTKWAQATFGACELGDSRRTKRLVKVAVQAASRPDGSTPQQTESWGDCQAVYRLFDQDDVTFGEIIRPHCEQTRASCCAGDVKLIINDTTEVDDRGADDFEVFCRIRAQNNQYVIRAARLNRWLLTPDGRSVQLKELLTELPCRETVTLEVPAKDGQPARTANLELRFAEVRMPLPKVLTPWLKEHRPSEPLSMWVVELREIQPPAGATPLRWVLYASEPVTELAAAHTVIGWYKRRPTIEDYHQALKSGCRVQQRYYETADRLERVTGLLSVVAVRLLQLKTAALETPHRPAVEVAPVQWVKLVQIARKKPVNAQMTIREFLRAVAGLGGHLGRKCDGEPGWITLWRGFEKLILLDRGADAQKRGSLG